jgi:hypothetical protein
VNTYREKQNQNPGNGCEIFLEALREKQEGIELENKLFEKELEFKIC